MVDIKTLLPELRKLVGELAEDLLARSTENIDIDAGLRKAFQQIEKGGRTAQAFEVWRDDYLDQVAVAWVLACVFVRFMEDNRLIDECWLAGEGERRKLAEGSHELFFRKHAHDTDREYFQHVFHEVSKIPAAADLFAKGKTPLWALAPSGDASMKLLRFWREIDAEEGHLLRSFSVESGDTRFLGDLYQDLSEKARKKYALLQTPVFVEEFILDRTLTPALDEFGLDKVRMIDPTCGSGHFLLGGFARLFREWCKVESNERMAAQKALDGVWGVDINPFAVAIARFRLIVAAVQACGILRLLDAPAWKIHLAAGDSLLWGCKPGWKGERVPIYRIDNPYEVETIYAVEDPAALREILGQGYQVVVGNPPYIIVRDRVLNAVYRDLYSSCGGKYSLGVPFTQRFWELAIQNDEPGTPMSKGAGYIGEITTNSFMKREFGKKLIEEFLNKTDLTHVIDTSGAYIPGHATPTVILLGRSQKPISDSIRAVQGIKGEPSTPEDPSLGLVWQSIIRHVDRVDTQNDYVSTADVPRTTFATHPWSIGGGGAAELKEQIDEMATQVLSDLCEIGIGVVTLEDDAYHVTSDFVRRHCISEDCQRGFVVGDILRDWSMVGIEPALFPHDGLTFEPVEHPVILKLLWPYKTGLSNRLWFRKTQIQRGLKWFEYGHISADKFRTRLSIPFAFVATHNHFVLDRGGNVFKQSAPVVKLPPNATEEDHLALLALLNSSTACFWMKQVSQKKQMTAGDGIRITSLAKVPYEFVGTQMHNMPVPKAFLNSDLRERMKLLGIRIDQCASRAGLLTAFAAIENGISGGETRISTIFRTYELERVQLRSEMIFLQEEIDFTAYVIYGMADGEILCDRWDWPNVILDAGQRPFELLQKRNVDDYPVPSNVPSQWPEVIQSIWRKRMDLIKRSKEISLIEEEQYKRRWIGIQGKFNHATQHDDLGAACKKWLLNRLEDKRYWPILELQSAAHLTDRASTDTEFMQVAALYRGRPDFDLAALVAEMLEGEAVPFLPILRYKATGLRKRAVWEQTWDLQRQEDAGENVGDIPVPPKYTSTDFVKSDYWRLRGKLDVPKERWISYPQCHTDSDPSLLVGWAGWNHLQQATALIGYYDFRKREGWDAKRLTPLLAGLDQLLPWVHQWHPEVSEEFGETAGKSYQTLLEQDAHELGLTLEDVRNWTPPEKARKTRTPSKKKSAAGEQDNV